MTPTIRLLPFAAADGPTNMASDEALLETASERGVAALRFYTWTEPTVSLGYFQSAAVLLARRASEGGGDPSLARRANPSPCDDHPTFALAGLPWVRRST